MRLGPSWLPAPRDLSYSKAIPSWSRSRAGREPELASVSRCGACAAPAVRAWAWLGGQPIPPTLRTLGTTLLPYVPRLAAEWDVETPGARWRELEATCCFVDISGFTALSERLARRGRIGAEELTEVLNHVFARMLAVAYEKGGNLLKFGGDALFLMFTSEDHALVAAQAAVAMRAALREARTLPTSV